MIIASTLPHWFVFAMHASIALAASTSLKSAQPSNPTEGPSYSCFRLQSIQRCFAKNCTSWLYLRTESIRLTIKSPIAGRENSPPLVLLQILLVPKISPCPHPPMVHRPIRLHYSRLPLSNKHIRILLDNLLILTVGGEDDVRDDDCFGVICC